jgi:hypothetical protein
MSISHRTRPVPGSGAAVPTICAGSPVTQALAGGTVTVGTNAAGETTYLQTTYLHDTPAGVHGPGRLIRAVTAVTALAGAALPGRHQ